MNSIKLRGVRTHNLKNIDLEIPRDKIVVFTGVSGSGKSSIVFDTIYIEAQRQLIETFSAFARRRLPKLSRPDVDEISNISTGIVIDQKRLGRTLRSTVGTATEIYTYLRLLFSRCAQPFIGFSHVYSFNHPEGMCPDCKGLGKRIHIDAEMMVDRELSLAQGAITHPDYKIGGYYWRDYTSNGLFDPDRKLKDFSKEDLDTLLYAEDIEITREHRGVIYKKKWTGLINRLEKLYINKSEDEVPDVRKDAYQKYLVYRDCDSCTGTRLNSLVLSATLKGVNIAQLSALELPLLDEYLSQFDDPVAQPLVYKMRAMLSHLIGIGAGYLTLNRAVATLSGGESQRVKMARQLDCDLTGLMYILDEPSIGLHPRDTQELLALLSRLRDKGNSVFVVEHDPDVILHADHIIEIGPKAGRHGGELCFQGTVSELLASQSVTGRMLRENAVPDTRRAPLGWFEIENANVNNLKDISVRIPRQVLCCVTGVSGSGKSSLIHGVFAKKYPCVVIDQSAVSRNSRSNAMTYTGIFDAIRKGFASATGEPASLFSFNSEGACPACKGSGVQKVEMNFIDDIEITCPECGGRRYTEHVLSLQWNGKTIYDLFETSIEDSVEFFADKKIRSQLELLVRVGLGYLHLGQPLSTLSGGEAQRLKLASELGKKGNLYIMDEPTTGLHLSDIARLMQIIKQLVDKGNSVIVIEHNPDVMISADWIIDIGPDGGSAGGYIIDEGIPEDVAARAKGHTGRYLQKYLLQKKS